MRTKRSRKTGEAGRFFSVAVSTVATVATVAAVAAVTEGVAGVAGETGSEFENVLLGLAVVVEVEVLEITLNSSR